jgi:hypothetical protein
MDMADETTPVGEQDVTPATPEVAPPVAEAPEQDAEYWKGEAKKAFEARDRAKEEARVASQSQYQPQQPVAPPAPEEDLNELYWKEPAKVIERLIGKQIEPFYVDRYEMQKAKYADDPIFKKHAPQIDQMVAAQPELRTKAGIVDQLYRVARAMEFDPDAERKRIEADVMARFNLKQAGSLEGAGTPLGATPSTPLAELSDDEKRVATKFYPDLAPREAYKNYASNKSKWAQGA